MDTRKVGATSQIFEIFVRDSSSTTGAGLTGLAYNSSGLTAYYHRSNQSSATAITPATMTLGTFTSSGFKEIDATNMPGWYQFCPPNAAFTSGQEVSFHLKGVTNMAPTVKVARLVAYDPDDAVNLGLSGLAAVVLATGQFFIKKNTNLNNFEFLMILTDHVTAGTGLTIVAQRSIDGGSFASCANSATEVANGIYKINLASTDLNGAIITLRFSATGADDRFITIITQP